MTKTKEELNDLKLEFEAINNKLNELTEDEFKMVVGGFDIPGLEAIGPSAFSSYRTHNGVDLEE